MLSTINIIPPSDVFNNLMSLLFSADKRQPRTPRRTQQPKTLNTLEDSTYYNLIHVSHKEMENDFRYCTTTKLCCQLLCDTVTTSPAISFHNALLIGNLFLCVVLLTRYVPRAKKYQPITKLSAKCSRVSSVLLTDNNFLLLLLFIQCPM